LGWRESKLLADQRSVDAFAWTRQSRKLLPAALHERQQRLEAWILTAALDRGDRWLRHLRAVRESTLRKACAASGAP